MPSRRPALALAFAAILAVACCRATADLATDARALTAFRAAVGQRVSWNVTDPATVCAWTGVTCEGGRVTILRLPGAALTGAVPAGSLGNLTALHTLSLRYNALSGALPSDLASLAALRSVFLNGNRLSGDFPAPLLALPGLLHLSLGGNGLSGAIPPALANLTRLRTLLLEENRFAGEIPDLPLPQLRDFNVSFNRLNGSIPASLRSRPRAAFLGMSALCGGPLGPCPGEAPPPSPAPTETTPSPTTPATNVPNGGNDEQTDKKGKKLSGGAIAGIAIASVVGAALLLFLLICLCRRTGRTKTRALEMPPPSPSPAVIPGGRKPPELPSGSALAPMDTVGHPAGQSTSGKKLVFFGSAAAVQPFDLDIARATPLSCTQVGHDKQGLPIGLQLIGCPWGETSLLSVASAVEELCLKKRNRPSTFYDILKT